MQEEQRMMLEEERRKREEFEKLQVHKETQLRGTLKFIFCFHFNGQNLNFPAKKKMFDIF